MKIALVITRLDKGGSAEVVLSLFQKLTEEGHDTTLIYGLTRDYPDNFKNISRNLGDKIIYIPCLRREISPFWDMLCLFKLIAIIKRNAFQIVHTNSSKAGFIGRLAAKLSGVRIIVHSPHGHIFYGYFGKIKIALFILLEKIAAKFTDRIIALTELGKQDHIKFGITNPGKLVSIYCGIDVSELLDVQVNLDEERRKWRLSKGELVIGMVARLVPVKGCEYFIKAMPAIKKEVPNTKFIIVGDGFLRQNLEKLAEGLGVSNDTIFTGHQSDIKGLMGIFDICVLPSLNEGLGRCLLEAQALGVPVVATNVGGVPEVVRNNETGILVPPKSPEALAQAIVALLKDDEKRKKMAKAAKNWIDGKFSINKMVEKISNVYRELMKIKRLSQILLFLTAIFLISSSRLDAKADEELIRVPAAIHISSSVSDGKFSIPEIVKIAKQNGIKILIITDRDVMRWEYGLWPLRRIIKKTLETDSVFTYGIKNYLKEIEEVQRKNPDLVLIPGVESAAFYYWEGTPFKNLKMYNWHKHILVIGLDKADDYQMLPSVANRHSLMLPFNLRDAYYFWPILFLMVGILCLRKRKFRYNDLQGHPLGEYSRAWRIFGVCIIIFSLLFLVNNFPFRSFKYDQYHGEQGIGPYQNLIDYINPKGGLTFWAHPEAENIEKRGGISIETRDYADNLLEARDYTGFAIFFEGYKKVGPPGGLWDEALKQYCQGRRKMPVWAIGGLAYEQTGDLGEYMKNFHTVFLMPSHLTRETALRALREGRMYVVRGKAGLTLDEFIVKDSLSGIHGAIGDNINLAEKPLVKISGHFKDGRSELLKINLIRNGIVVKTFAVMSPFEVSYQDGYFDEGNKIYYRLEILWPGGILITNPVFVKFTS